MIKKFLTLLLTTFQVASVKPNGDRIQVSLPLSCIPEQEALRDASDYDYEDAADDVDEVSKLSILMLL
jgi:hypothetical protein